MNLFLASAIFKEKWCIEPRSAQAYGLTLSMMLEGNNDYLSVIAHELMPSAISTDGIKRGKIEDAQKGDIAVIPVIGPLMKYSQFCGAMGMQSMEQWIKNADANPNIKGIILRIDSPGGTVSGTESLANVIKDTKKPVVAFVDEMMCSAAMWIGSACDEIISSLPNNEIGSIGVMISFADMQPYYEAQGIKFHKINADQSSDKNKIVQEALDGNYDNIKKEMLNPIADTFIATIKENRPNVKENQLTGKVFLAKDVKGTLIDEIGNFEYAMERVLALYKPEIKTIKLQ